MGDPGNDVQALARSSDTGGAVALTRLKSGAKHSEFWSGQGGASLLYLRPHALSAQIGHKDRDHRIGRARASGILDQIRQQLPQKHVR